jgi:hypothetical protein
MDEHFYAIPLFLAGLEHTICSIRFDRNFIHGPIMIYEAIYKDFPNIGKEYQGYMDPKVLDSYPSLTFLYG